MLTILPGPRDCSRRSSCSQPLEFFCVVAASVLGSKVVYLARQVASTKSEVETVNQTIEDLSTIVSFFDELEELYGKLNEFWRVMGSNTDYIAKLDEVIVDAIGRKILSYFLPITQAKTTTDGMKMACKAYPRA